MKPLQAEEVQFMLLSGFISPSRPLDIYKVAHFIMIKFSHKNILRSIQIFPRTELFVLFETSET